MKWKRVSPEFLSEKTFLVIKNDLGAVQEKSKHRGKPRTANTGTWPPKMKRVSTLYDEPERPKTASLERPSVLDPDLVDKLDMSLLSKELLCDSVTRFRQSKTISGGVPSLPSSSRRRQSVTVGDQQRRTPASAATTWCNGNATRHKRRSFEQILEPKFCQIDVLAISPRMQKQARMIVQDYGATKRRSTDSKKLDDNNNRNGTNGAGKVVSLSTLKKNSRSAIPTDLEVFTASSTRSAPEPCKTCGRPDQPERFHSHPKGTHPKPKENSTASKTKVPKSIQKPVALNFRSERSKNKVGDGLETQETKSKSQNAQERQPSRPSSAPIKRGPRTITCYICGREFGTASFPIHEPRCMQKWELENNSLPGNQKRPPPQRPEAEIGNCEWNAAAWEESQAQLVPCAKCGRTFLPERLPVHQRSCKATPKSVEPERFASTAPERQLTSTSKAGPPTVACKICGRNFGTRSIKIHEPQCRKRWQIENSGQPSNQRKRETIVGQKSGTLSSNEAVAFISPTGDTQQKRTVTCYICGRDFGSSSIVIHEPQCLKKWHCENDKLPPDQRRKEPEKPEAVYTHDPETGNLTMDLAAMAEASWNSHLSQLVPCKRCGRTFNPDRVNIHERNCKGNR